LPVEGWDRSCFGALLAVTEPLTFSSIVGHGPL